MKNSKAAITAPIYVSVVMILLGISGKLLELTMKEGGDDFFFTAMLLQLFVYMIPAALYCKFRGLDFIKVSGSRLMSPGHLPFVISAFFLYIFGMMFLLYFGATPSDASEMNYTLRSVPETDSFFVILCYIVIPAVAEEMLFRAVLLSEYSSCTGAWTVFISSVFFAMLHFSFTAFLSYFWAGLVFGLVTYVTGSALPAVILHMLSNFYTLYFSHIISDFLKGAENSVVLIFLMSVLFLVFLYLTVSCLETIYEKKAKQYDEGTLSGSRVDAVKRLAKAGRVDKSRRAEAKEPSKNTFKDVFLTPSTLFAVFVFVFITLGII